MRRIWFKIRWWKWFLTAPRFLPQFMYTGITRLDRESRQIVSDRIQDEWLAREPKEKSQ